MNAPEQEPSAFARVLGAVLGAGARAGLAGARMVRGQVVDMVGGPARARVVLLFGAVLALNSAQIATVGAVAPELERSFDIHNAGIGLLSSVSLLVGALAVIPVGLLVDRSRRVPLLAASILLWSAATLWGAAAPSYTGLLLSRLALGAVAATAGPAIASLTGDYFPSSERGRVYAYILGGEIAGTAAGFIVSGTLANLLSWRVAFVVLAIPGLFLARALWRTVPEPLRGGQSRLARGETRLSATDSGTHDPSDWWAGIEDAQGAEDEPARDAARRRGVRPDGRLVLRQDPRTMSLWQAIVYVLRVPSNLLLIIGSSLGYFFLAGLQTFVVVFVEGQYHASQTTATLFLGLLVIGSLAGTLLSGRVTDALVRRGMLESRMWVPAICYLGAAALLIPGLLAGSLGSGLWFDIGGATLVSAANPPLDAARLDIMPPGLWGRAESVRTLLRSLAQAVAPLLFGVLADVVAGIVPEQAPIGTHTHGTISPTAATGLQVSFLIMLTTLAAAGVVLWRARRTYATDVATADASSAMGSGPRGPVPGARAAIEGTT